MNSYSSISATLLTTKSVMPIVNSPAMKVEELIQSEMVFLWGNDWVFESPKGTAAIS